MASSSEKTICVAGASGYIGSWLVQRLLKRGYTVRATVLDPDNMEEVKHLIEIRGGETRLSIWKADLRREGSFDEVISGCNGVFHLATPMDFESKDPENEMIKPTVNGLLDIMKACLKAKTVRRLIFTSSAGAVDISEQQRSLYDETCWTDVEFCRREKMTGWMYFISKTLAEQEGWKFAKQHNMDFITINPTLVVGPFLVNSMPPSLITALSPITGNEAHYSIMKHGHFVHLDDVCMAHIFLFEHPNVEGRYICSSHDATIHDVARLLNQKYPQYSVATKNTNIPDDLELVHFSSKKIKDLGFQFKYNLEDMFTAAVDTCIEKGLLPNPTETK